MPGTPPVGARAQWPLVEWVSGCQWASSSLFLLQNYCCYSSIFTLLFEFLKHLFNSMKNAASITLSLYISLGKNNIFLEYCVSPWKNMGTSTYCLSPFIKISHYVLHFYFCSSRTFHLRLIFSNFMNFLKLWMGFKGYIFLGTLSTWLEKSKGLIGNSHLLPPLLVPSSWPHSCSVPLISHLYWFSCFFCCLFSTVRFVTFRN